MASNDSTKGDAPSDDNSQFIDKLVNDAKDTHVKAQSLISELQEKIREVESKISNLEIDGKTAQGDGSNIGDLPSTAKQDEDAPKIKSEDVEELIRDLEVVVKHQEATAKFLINALKETLPESKFAAFRSIINKVCNSQQRAARTVGIICDCARQKYRTGGVSVNVPVERDRAAYAFRHFTINLLKLRDAFMAATDEANDPVYISHAHNQV
ncbi:hypothetical protein B0T20DRAFT_483371 [Sordaria brevicollis]|uniref:Uncharacterized protein n=1 Tax=Sordaria brevicollis TaxID=83679 RepID=A0AAE0P111_SORBR|nr:hypothetical protein B0T20DRAFT_483371 [Sordaria brevicollis]